MQIFDFNIHLTSIEHDDVNIVIAEDLSLTVAGIEKGFELHQSTIQKCIGANFLLFNTKLFKEDVSPFFKKTKAYIKNAKYTALVDFRSASVFAYLDTIKECGVNAIMFNSYLQEISAADFDNVINVCKHAEKLGLIICIDGSYGTSKMYTYDNMKLACSVADAVSKVPIVIVHAGGYRVVEAMLLAAEKKNVWLDTSFSLPYYKLASIEMDFAFAIKKLDCAKIVFGSDHPYIRFEHAVESHLDFFDRFGFASTQIEMIMSSNSHELFNVK